MNFKKEEISLSSNLKENQNSKKFDKILMINTGSEGEETINEESCEDDDIDFDLAQQNLKNLSSKQESGKSIQGLFDSVKSLFS